MVPPYHKNTKAVHLLLEKKCLMTLLKGTPKSFKRRKGSTIKEHEGSFRKQEHKCYSEEVECAMDMLVLGYNIEIKAS